MNSENMNTEFRERLEKLIGEEKPFPWGRRIGLSPGVFNRMWNEGTPPKADALALISKETGVSLDWLILGIGPKKHGERVSGITPAYLGDNNEPSALQLHSGQNIAEGYVQVPRYKVQASAGGGSVIHSEQIVDFLSFRADWIHKTLGLSEKDLALINVLGDSMEPTLSNDDVILIDMGKKGIHDNSVYVLHFNGVLLVKRIQRKLDGSVIVKSDNLVYEPEVVRGDMLDTLNVVGRVVWCGRRM